MYKTEIIFSRSLIAPVQDIICRSEGVNGFIMCFECEGLPRDKVRIDYTADKIVTERLKLRINNAYPEIQIKMHSL